MKKIISLFTAALLCISLAGCSPKYEKFSGAFKSFDTIIQMVSYNESREDFDRMRTYTENRYNELHQLYDIYNHYRGVNNIHTINDNAGKEPVKVEQEIIDLLLFSKEWHEKSGGKMNVAMGSVLRVWHDKRDEYSNIKEVVNPVTSRHISLPGKEMLAEKAQHTDINRVIIDRENMTVFITDENVQLDVGAVAKGFATEMIADELQAMGYDSFLISAGGNVKSCGRPKDDRQRWGVALENPAVDENWQMIGGSIDIAYFNTEMSLVCSGGYQRYMVIDGQRYHHLIDPATNYPEEVYLGVAVMCSDSGMADALSTTIFMMEPEKAMEFVENFDGVDCVLVESDGTMHVSSGAGAYLASRGITNQTK